MLPPDYVHRAVPAGVAPADRGRLLLLVLEAGHAFLVRARGALEQGDVAGFAADLRRTQDAILELTQAIDHRADAAMAASLTRLYDVMIGQLALATAERSLAHVDEVLRTYVPIVEAYREAVGRTRAGG